MIINFSNHPSSKWSDKQKEAAAKWGEIKDIPFPEVDPLACEEELVELAEEIVNEIVANKPEAVMCQGEFTLSYSVIRRLIEVGIPVYAACSRRYVNESKDSEGQIKKVVLFKFERFRRYY